MAEIELSMLNQQCLDRRIPDQATLEREVAAWEEERNRAAATVNWRFTTDDARIKLKKLYPSIQRKSASHRVTGPAFTGTLVLHFHPALIPALAL